MESCLLFTSGYAANVGAISALAGPGETVLSDALNHASIVDGCRLSRAEVVVLPHLDVAALERALAAGSGVRWVVTESYFSMDGDSPDLVRMREICDAHGAALIVDEAHALGVFGPEGRGLCAAQDVVPDLLIGGMGKALGMQGGFVAGSALYRGWLWNRARSFVFSTATSPLLCDIVRQRVEYVREASLARTRLAELERQLASALAAIGVATPAGRHGPLFPIVLGSEHAAVAGATRALEHGVLCHPIRPPTVPRGLSRLRVTLRADLFDADVEKIAGALGAAWKERTLDDRAGPSTTESQSADPLPQRDRGGTAPTNVFSETASPAEHSLGDRGSGRPSPVLPPTQPEAPPREPGTQRASPVRAGVAPTARRWIVLGTGTGVGKTYVARALVRAIASRGQAVAGLKPVETGIIPQSASDAAELAALAFGVRLPCPHPLYGFTDPVTPARAARAQGTAIEVRRIAAWAATVVATSGEPADLVIETAGGVFSPLSDRDTNFELAAAFETATWVLVAPNRLGVLHDVSSALQAMSARGRSPDWIVLSATATPDPSTDSNREELGRLYAMPPIIELARHDERPLRALLADTQASTHGDGRPPRS